MHFEKPGKQPFYEWLGFWVPHTTGRWYGEGLPLGANPEDYFGLDEREYIWLDLGPIPQFVPKTIEETDRYKIEINYLGITTKNLKDYSCFPTFIDFPVKTREDFEKMKKRFDPYDQRRYPKTWGDELIEYYRTVDHPVGLFIPGFFGQPRNFMGLERLLVTFYKDPDLMHKMNSFWADFLIKVIEEAVKRAKIDFVVIWEDMSYKNGPHISPRLFREFMLPHYKEVTSFLRKNGIDIIMVDTDGNPEVLIPLLLEGGVNSLHPLEAASGMDVVALRKEYGKRLSFIGNIDKRALIEGGEAIEREVNAKLTPLMKDGGYIPSVDHAVPPDVPFKNYVHYIQVLKKHLHQA